MLEFLIDNIFVSFGGTLFQQVVGIPMGTNCAPLIQSSVYSGFSLYRVPVYLRFSLYRIPIYLGFSLYRIPVYSGFSLYRIPVYLGFTGILYKLNPE
jgi:hypothetical protein